MQIYNMSIRSVSVLLLKYPQMQKTRERIHTIYKQHSYILITIISRVET